MKAHTEPQSALLGYDEVHEARRSVIAQLGDTQPEIGIILGSGLGQLESSIQNKQSLAYEQITHMPSPSVQGHGGRLLLGKLGGKSVACLSGRVHLYEGHGTDRVVFGVRLLAHLGIKTLIVTNASGGIGPDCGPGRFLLISDHLNFTGHNPLIGPNDDRFGPRFVDMTETYDPELRALARRVGDQLSFPLLEGVYVGVSGPSYETPAEINMFHHWGASAVGMSTVHEVIAARHLDLRVLGISCITNFAAGRAPSALNHEDVKKEAQKSSSAFCSLVGTICEQI